MAAHDRHDQIISILDRYKSISVEKLSKLVYASPATIRRDLIVLEQQGVLRRTHGGAVSMRGNNFDLPVYMRTASNQKEKEIIAQLASEFVTDSSTYFIDSSSTCCFLAQKLTAHTGLTVATNGVEIISILKECVGVRLISCGGEMRTNYDEFTGPLTLHAISQFYADTLFLSCRGISLKAGATETNSANAAIKQQFRKNARQCILLCDSSKFEQEFFYKSLDFSEIDYIITDKKPKDHALVSALGEKLIYSRK